MKSIALGIIAALFFASTFVLNQTMALHGGSWLWSSALRYFWTVPILGIWVVWQGQGPALWREFRRCPWSWVLWGTVGFGFFYAPLTFAAAYAPSWAVASTFQLTIIIGSLLVPFTTGNRIPWRHLWPSLPILAGIGLVQWNHTAHVGAVMILALGAVMMAATAYPLGNRKMMAVTGGKLSSPARILGMTVGSLPFWGILAVIGYRTAGAPSAAQWSETLLVAVLSGVVATALFFRATDSAHGHPATLARVEATQSMEIVFTLLLAQLLGLPGAVSGASAAGMALVMGGMVWHAASSRAAPSLQRGASFPAVKDS